MQQICDAVKPLLPTAASVFTVKEKRKKGKANEHALLRQQNISSTGQETVPWTIPLN